MAPQPMTAATKAVSINQAHADKSHRTGPSSMTKDGIVLNEDASP
jgi:hypothetical protein